MLRWRRLHELAAPVASLAGHRLEVRYQPGAGVEQELAELAAAESTCCAFVTWNVTSIDGQPTLRVTTTPEAPDALEPIAALFGVSEEARSL
jgi:hypothetical protein